MVDYKIVKFCRLCKARFVVHKSEAKRNYCDDCQLKISNVQDDSGGEKK